eukprot:6117527-Prymnesium_polylepis.1
MVTGEPGSSITHSSLPMSAPSRLSSPCPVLAGRLRRQGGAGAHRWPRCCREDECACALRRWESHRRPRTPPAPRALALSCHPGWPTPKRRRRVVTQPSCTS